MVQRPPSIKWAYPPLSRNQGSHMAFEGKMSFRSTSGNCSLVLGKGPHLQRIQPQSAVT